MSYCKINIHEFHSKVFNRYYDKYIVWPSFTDSEVKAIDASVRSNKYIDIVHCNYMGDITKTKMSIYKLEDEWFYLYAKIPMNESGDSLCFYKCDQLHGLIECLEINFIFSISSSVKCSQLSLMNLSLSSLICSLGPAIAL